jgi:hypothetical protein
MQRIGDRVKVPRRMVKALLTLVAALLTFGGPTYIAYVFESLGAPPFLYFLLSLAFFVAGVFLFMRLFGEEAESKSSK